MYKIEPHLQETVMSLNYGKVNVAISFNYVEFSQTF